MSDDGYCEVDFSDESDDADPVEFHNVVTVKAARKAHVCCECRGPIQLGESYQRANYKYEGDMSTDTICAPCAETKAEFQYHVFGGDLWGNLCEQWDRGAHITACIQRLSTARAKEHMRQQWLKWHESERQQALRNRAANKRGSTGGGNGQGGPFAPDSSSPSTREKEQ